MRHEFEAFHSNYFGLGKGYNPCLLLLFESGEEDLLETVQEKAGEKKTIFEKDEKSRKMETRSE